MIYLSRGNKKLSKGFLIWNLPAQDTCPLSTPVCKRICYAKKAERIYLNVKVCRQRNFQATFRPTFYEDLVVSIANELVNNTAFSGFFRIHESGDFYDQRYLNIWKRVAVNFPKIKFLAFTKSFHLNFEDLPSNLTIVMSVMSDTTATVPEGFPIAYAGDCKDMVDTIECPGQCDNCGMCWVLPQLKKNVHFKIH